MKTLTCTCCGAEITRPQFFDGKPYGWSCIKKVCPTQKQSKAVFVPCEVLKNVSAVAGRYAEITVMIAGKKYYKLFPSAMVPGLLTEQDGQHFAILELFAAK